MEKAPSCSCAFISWINLSNHYLNHSQGLMTIGSISSAIFMASFATSGFILGAFIRDMLSRSCFGVSQPSTRDAISSVSLTNIIANSDILTPTSLARERSLSRGAFANFFNTQAFHWRPCHIEELVLNSAFVNVTKNNLCSTRLRVEHPKA